MSRFLSSFKTYFLNATDACTEYAEVAGLMSLCSIAMGRRTLDYGRGIKPNLFLMVSGPSTIGRKSTTVEIAQTMIKGVDIERVGPRDYTIEGLLKWMAEKDPQTGKSKNKVALFAPEFGSDLARADSYAGTFTTDMCALYDGESFQKVRAKSSTINVDNPSVMLFSACAYSMLQKYMKPKDWTNGFLMRFLFCAPNPQTVRPRWTLQPQDPGALRQSAVTSLDILKRDLEATKLTPYRLMRLDPQAEVLYKQMVDMIDTWNLGPTAQTYRGRFSINILKLAMLYQIDIDPNMSITALAMGQAVNLALYTLWPSFVQSYARTALDDFEGLFFNVLEFMAKRSGMLTPRVDLAQEFLANQRLDHVIDYMKKQGLLASQKTNTGGEGLWLTRQIDVRI